MADRQPPRDTELNSFGGRLGRYAKVTGAMGGVAARMAGNRVFGGGAGRDDGAMARELREALGGLKGPLMKVAQIMSTIPDALPEDYAAELAQLQANAPHMGWPFVKRRMAAELGNDWQSRFASFSREAVAAASLGQVHEATTHDGRRLACKLQYPEMASVVEADLRQLRVILGLYRRYDGAIDPSAVQEELAERLREELDYVHEAGNMRLYRLMLAEESHIHVPEPLDELTTRRLLTMTWLDGRRLLTLKEAPLERRNRVAETMFRCWYVPFYRYGVIHGDPHLGNYSITEDDGVNLLDFGAIRVFRPSFVGGVIGLYDALRTGDRDQAVAAYEAWGFENLTTELIEVLNIWAAFLYAPLMEDRIRLISEMPNGIYGRQVATRVHQELKRVGGVRLPREFVLMDRAAIGLGSVFLHLGAEINWAGLFRSMIEDFDEAALAERQAAALRAAGLSVDPVTRQT